MGGLPVLEKAPDLIMKSVRAEMPLVVPRSTGSERCLEAFLSIFLWLVYLGHSVSMWFLDSRVVLSQGARGSLLGLGREEGMSVGILLYMRAKDFALVFQVLEVFGGVHGGFEAVCDREPAFILGLFPILAPQLSCGGFGSLFCIGSGGAEWDLAVE